MAVKVAERIDQAGAKPAIPVKRLCNEIQLFDLCELEKCRHKDGLFCTDAGLLNRFEAIAEEEVRRPAAGSDSDDLDEQDGLDDEWGDGGEYDDAGDDEGFGDEDYEED